MVTKKIRTEYMKKFRDPKWETFSKCYEESLKYRLTRRVMEHSHKSWFWEGWDSSSDSSGLSTPRLTRNRVAPLSVAPPPCSEMKQKLLDLKSSPELKPPSEESEAEVAAKEAAVVEADVVDAASPTGTLMENGVNDASGGSVAAAPNTIRPSEETATDDGPVNASSSDGEPVNPAPKLRQRRRTPRSEVEHRDSSHDNNNPPAVRKPQRAKSQPPSSTKEESRWSSCRLDWTERQTEVKKTANDSHTADACVQTHRESSKRSSNVERRRARSADLEKTRRSQLTVADDHWMTEYMRCFSARLR